MIAPAAYHCEYSEAICIDILAIAWFPRFSH
jgi:hypothetical protein